MRFRCRNNACGRLPQGFVFEGDLPQCPKCGTGRHVVPIVDVHFIVIGSGPIYGAAGFQHVACEPKRDGLALHPHDEYAATDDPRAVTCRSCRGTPAWRDMAKAFKELLPDLAQMTQ